MKKLATLVLLSFGFNLHAEDIAAPLNARFNATPESCTNNLPAYYCSGIIIRTNEDSSSLTPRLTWVPDEIAQKKIKLAASFIRKDISNATKSVWGRESIGHGIIVFPQSGGSLITRCIFPSNGFSDANQDNGCGDRDINFKAIDEDNSNCLKHNVTTADEWMNDRQCSFNSHSPKYFNEALRTQNLVHDQIDKYEWNELVINISPDFWDLKNPGNLPIEAFWYVKNDDQASDYLSGLKGAQYEQESYHNVSKRWLPIVLLNTESTASPFTYDKADQAVNPPNKRHINIAPTDL